MTKLNMFINWLKEIFNPDYQLMLSDVIKSNLPFETKYIFKQYGSHEYISLTFSDIKNNSNLLRNINPGHLLEINAHEYSLKKEFNTYHIVEEIRGNVYRLKNMKEEIFCSGEYIYKNIDLYSDLNIKDLSKIIYTTGFSQGRKVSLTLRMTVKENDPSAKKHKNDNIIVFKTPQ